MLWIMLIGGFLGAICTAIWNFMEMFDYWYGFCFDWNLLIVPGLFALLGIIGWLGLSVVYSMDYEESELSEEYNLVSLKDSSQLNGDASGGLFYVYASLGTEEVYTYYYELETGGYKRGKIPAEDTIIFEEENCAPKILEYIVYTKNKLGKTLKMLLTFSNPISERYEIFVPKGTVLKTFQLDLE